eukprot:11100458-Karenia_brevis.AAC.1
MSVLLMIRLFWERRVRRGLPRPFFFTTLRDWEEKVHTGKTERIRLSGTPRSVYDVRGEGEAETVRHVGGWVSERGDYVVDTKRKVAR